MRNPGGYAFIVAPNQSIANFDKVRCEEISAGTTELDTFTCFHCNRVIHTKPKMDPADLGGLCKICMKLICPTCLGEGCKPWEEKMLQQERRQEARRSYGL